MRRRLQEAQDANRERGKKTKDKILSLIAQSEPQGMSTQELCKAAGLHRDRIHVVCKEYMDERILEKTGRFGKYHLGEKAVEDPKLAAFLFEHNMVSMAGKRFFKLSDRDIALVASTEFCDTAYCEKIVEQWRQREGKDRSAEEKDLDHYLRLYFFEYALRLGAMVSYQLIQSMRYAQQQPSHVNKSSRIMVIQKWLDDTVTPSFLIYSFYAFLNILENRSSKGGPIYWPDRMEERPVSEMENLFKKTFPTLFEELERVRTSIPAQINAYKQRLSEPEKK